MQFCCCIAVVVVVVVVAAAVVFVVVAIVVCKILSALSFAELPAGLLLFFPSLSLDPVSLLRSAEGLWGPGCRCFPQGFSRGDSFYPT